MYDALAATYAKLPNKPNSQNQSLLAHSGIRLPAMNRCDNEEVATTRMSRTYTTEGTASTVSGPLGGPPYGDDPADQGQIQAGITYEQNFLNGFCP
jgi:hypothetical protein